MDEAAKLERLRAALQEGLDAAERGDVITLEPHEIGPFMDAIGREVEERARRRGPQRR
ncbi:hypothetical protein [Azospirillum sp.]|uniref:hypothetical protein n=1 Tax=Azospirillum sp. TaxID=34012 RepID=UPI002D4C2118|nr:hypothetical protein [Azospirillum sp.]HYD67034.1 hypothetical protein [Azospirillum sp.]